MYPHEAERAFSFERNDNLHFPGGMVWNVHQSWRLFSPCKPGQRLAACGLYARDDRLFTSHSIPCVMDDFGNLVKVTQ